LANIADRKVAEEKLKLLYRDHNDHCVANEFPVKAQPTPLDKGIWEKDDDDYVDVTPVELKENTSGASAPASARVTRSQRRSTKVPTNYQDPPDYDIDTANKIMEYNAKLPSSSVPSSMPSSMPSSAFSTSSSSSSSSSITPSAAVPSATDRKRKARSADSSIVCLPVGDLNPKSDKGKLLLYLAVPEGSTKAFVILAEIVALVRDKKDKKILWMDTIDYVSSKDQHYLQSISDGIWKPPIAQASREACWTDATTCCLICFTGGLNRDHKIQKTASKIAINALQNSVHLDAIEFMSRQNHSRPKRK